MLKILLSDVFRLAPGQLAQVIGGVGVTIILGKYLSPEELIIYTLYFLTQNYIVNLSAGWLTNSAVRFLPERPELLRSLINITIVEAICLIGFGSIISLFASSFFSQYINSAYTLLTVLLASEAFVFSVFQCSLRGMFDQKWFSWSSVIFVISKLSLLAIFLPNSADPILLVLILTVLSYMPVLLIQWIILRNKYRDIRNITINYYKSFFQESIKYSLPLTISLLLINFLQTGDRYVLSAILERNDVGVYTFWSGIGIQLNMALYRFISMALNPRLFQLYFKAPDFAIKYVRDISNSYLLIGGPIIVVVGIIIQFGIKIFGIKLEYIGDSYLIYYGIVVAYFMGLTQLTGIIKHFEKMTGIFITASVVSIIVMISVTYICATIFELPGAGLGTLFAIFTYYFMVTYSSKSWPSILDFIISIIISSLLVIMYYLFTIKFGLLLSGIATFSILLIYLIFVYIFIRRKYFRLQYL